MEFEVNLIAQFRCDSMARKDVKDVAVGQIALFLGKQNEFLDFFGEIQFRRGGGAARYTAREATRAVERGGPPAWEAPFLAFRLTRPLEAFGAFDLSIVGQALVVTKPGAKPAFVQTRFTQG